MVQAIEEACHCLFITLFNVGMDHVELHLLEVLFHGLCPLTKRLKLVEEVTRVVRRNKVGSHMSLHILPSCDWRIFFCFLSELDLFPPKVGILIKLEGCHGHHLLIATVVHAEDLVYLEFPREIFLGLIRTGELRHGEFELAESFFSIAVPVASVAMIWAVIIIIRALMSCLVIVALLLRLLRCRVWWWNLLLTTSLGSLLVLLSRLRTRRRLMVLTTSLGSLLLFLSWVMSRSIVLRPMARRTSSRMSNGLLFFFFLV